MTSQQLEAGHEHLDPEAPRDSSLIPTEFILRLGPVFLVGSQHHELLLRRTERTEGKKEGKKAFSPATGTYCSIKCTKNVFGFMMITLF